MYKVVALLAAMAARRAFIRLSTSDRAGEISPTSVAARLQGTQPISECQEVMSSCTGFGAKRAFTSVRAGEILRTHVAARLQEGRGKKDGHTFYKGWNGLTHERSLQGEETLLTLSTFSPRQLQRRHNRGKAT